MNNVGTGEGDASRRACSGQSACEGMRQKRVLSPVFTDFGVCEEDNLFAFLPLACISLLHSFATQDHNASPL